MDNRSETNVNYSKYLEFDKLSIYNILLVLTVLAGTLKIADRFIVLGIPINYLLISLNIFFIFPLRKIDSYFLKIFSSILIILVASYFFKDTSISIPSNELTNKILEYLTIPLIAFCASGIFYKLNAKSSFQKIFSVRHAWILSTTLICTLTLGIRLFTGDFSRFGFSIFGPIVFSRLILISYYLSLLPSKFYKKYRIYLLIIYIPCLLIADSKITIASIIGAEIFVYIVDLFLKSKVTFDNLKLPKINLKKNQLKYFLITLLLLIISLVLSKRYQMFFLVISPYLNSDNVSLEIFDNIYIYTENFANELGIDSTISRLLAYSKSWQLILAKPLFGNGIATWPYLSNLVYMVYPHNFLLEVYYAVGVFSLPFIYYIFKPIYKLTFYPLNTSDEFIFRPILIKIFLIIFLTSMVSGSIQDLRMLILFTIIAV